VTAERGERHDHQPFRALRLDPVRSGGGNRDARRKPRLGFGTRSGWWSWPWAWLGCSRQAARCRPLSNRNLAERLCRAGDRVQLRTYANVDRMGILDAASDDLLAWLGDRPAGRPAGSTCQS
jgi:hypothetical protein